MAYKIWREEKNRFIKRFAEYKRYQKIIVNFKSSLQNETNSEKQNNLGDSKNEKALISDKQNSNKSSLKQDYFKTGLQTKPSSYNDLTTGQIKFSKILIRSYEIIGNIKISYAEQIDNIRKQIKGIKDQINNPKLKVEEIKSMRKEIRSKNEELEKFSNKEKEAYKILKEEILFLLETFSPKTTKARLKELALQKIKPFKTKKAFWNDWEK